MRTVLAAGAAMIIVLSVLSANLWLDLRTARQDGAELRAQMARMQSSAAPNATVRATPTQVAATVEPVMAVATSDLNATAPTAAPPPPPPAIEVMPPPRPVQAPVVITEARRTGALLQSDRTATARAMFWKDSIALAGHALSTEQLQALNAVAIAELRRETEEALEAEATMAAPTDVQTAVRMREETINRQNETNQRILRAVSAKLTAAQTEALRAQFASGHAARMATFEAEREMLQQQGR